MMHQDEDWPNIQEKHFDQQVIDFFSKFTWFRHLPLGYLYNQGSYPNQSINISARVRVGNEYNASL
jgi:hypothetical protein